MGRQVYAIFVFMGVVLLSSAFMQTRQPDANVVQEDQVIDISKIGTATALLALKDDRVSQPFGINQDLAPTPAPQQQVATGEEEESVEYIDPTFCDLAITQPVAGATVSSQISVLGFKGNVENPDCNWTVFEANAGGVQAFDATGVAISDYTILNSVGEWMQIPSYFQGSVSLNQAPATPNGYLRFVEHDVQEGDPDIFVIPVMFSTYAETPDEDGSSFFDSITDIFRRRQEIADIPEPEPVAPDFSDFVTTQEPSLEIPDNDSRELPAGISVGDSDDYCEIRNADRLICYGKYVDSDQETCGCTGFPQLETFRSKTTLRVDVEALKESSFDKTLFWGDRGDNIRMLQRALYVLSYYEYEIPSGIYDNETRKAVAKLQKENDISGAGIIVGVKTRALLNAIFDAY